MDRMVLVLKSSPERERQLEALLDAQQRKGSPEYHRWLTPEEFGRRFGPTEEQLTQVEGWLKSEGFTVDSVAHGRRWMEFSGTAQQVEDAFQTRMRRYEVDGVTHIANESDISIPGDVAWEVAGVVSLNDFFWEPPRTWQAHVERIAYGRKPPMSVPDDTTEGGAHYLAPGDFAIIYDLKALYDNGQDGSGQTIAVVANSNIDSNDVKTFREIFSLPPNRAPVIILNGSDPGFTAGRQEVTFDTEWAGAVARNATVDVVVSGNASAPGQDLSAMYIVNSDLAGIITDSFASGCEPQMGARNDLYNTLWEQAAAQGSSVFVASGDSGPDQCDDHGEAMHPAEGGFAVSGVASTPFDTAVGGTQFDENMDDSAYWSKNNAPPGFTSAKGYIPEKAWDESCDIRVMECKDNEFNLAATGGGASTKYYKPSWQLLSLTGMIDPIRRDLPDVSLASADHDGHIFCLSVSSGSSCTITTDSSGNITGFQKPEIFFGTSAAAPTFAGMMAIVDQANGGRQGLANYVLYQLAAQEHYPACASSTSPPPAGCVFNDITTGNNDVPCQADPVNCPNGSEVGYTAYSGYDLTTGLGSVNAANLVAAWSSAAPQNPSPPLFQLATSQPVESVGAGGIAIYRVTITTSGGFAGGINLTCSAPGTSRSCSVSPNVVYAVGAPIEYGLIVTAKAPQPARWSPLPVPGLLMYLGLSAAFAGMVTASARRTPKQALAIAMCLCLILGTSGCGTTASTSTLVVTAASGQFSTTLSLTLITR